MSVEVGDILNKAINLMFLFRRDDKLWPGKIYTSNILDLDLNYLPTRMAWCYGTPGTAVALFKMCQLIDLNFIDDINESLIAQMRSSDKNVYSLTMCHGLAGVTFIYDLIGKIIQSEANSLCRRASPTNNYIVFNYKSIWVYWQRKIWRNRSWTGVNRDIARGIRDSVILIKSLQWRGAIVAKNIYLIWKGEQNV